MVLMKAFTVSHLVWKKHKDMIKNPSYNEPE